MRGQFIVNNFGLASAFTLRFDDLDWVNLYQTKSGGQKVLSFECANEPPERGGSVAFLGRWFEVVYRTFNDYVWQVCAVEAGVDVRLDTLGDVDMLPCRSDSGGYLYVLELSSRVIKLGMTANPRERLATHIKQAGAFGSRITGAWLSDHHANHKGSEQVALCELAARSTQSFGPERFDGVSFRDAVDIAIAAIAGSKSHG